MEGRYQTFDVLTYCSDDIEWKLEKISTPAVYLPDADWHDTAKNTFGAYSVYFCSMGVFFWSHTSLGTIVTYPALYYVEGPFNFMPIRVQYCKCSRALSQRLLTVVVMERASGLVHLYRVVSSSCFNECLAWLFNILATAPWTDDSMRAWGGGGGLGNMLLTYFCHDLQTDIYHDLQAGIMIFKQVS